MPQCMWIERQESKSYKESNLTVMHLKPFKSCFLEKRCAVLAFKGSKIQILPRKLTYSDYFLSFLDKSAFWVLNNSISVSAELISQFYDCLFTFWTHGTKTNCVTQPLKTKSTNSDLSGFFFEKSQFRFFPRVKQSSRSVGNETRKRKLVKSK